MKRNTKRVAYKRKTIRKTKMRRRIQRGGVRMTTYMKIAGQQMAKTGDYEGDMNANGQPNGQGTMRYDNGTIYVGHWLNGEMNGQGTMRYANSYYEGEWQNAQRHGNGRFVLADGEIQEGTWSQNNLIHGRIRRPDGSVYEGHWLNGSLTQGRITYPNGTWYEGSFQNGVPHGHGIMHANGDTYDGEWFSGHKIQGRMNYQNGDQYNGQFHGGVKHGQGEMTYADGRFVSGIWQNDVLVNIMYENRGVASRTRESGAVPSGYEIGPAQTIENPATFSTTRRPEVIITLSDGLQYNIAMARDLYTRISIQNRNYQQITNFNNTPLQQSDMANLEQFVNFSRGGKKRRAVSK
jgi:hypothetical protein